MAVLCFIGFGGLLVVWLFFYLLNTARKKTGTPAGPVKDYTPVYVELADKPNSILLGMDKFVAAVQRTETAGDKWRWIPMLIFVAGFGLIFFDLLLILFGYFSYVFSAGAIALWVAALVMARSLRKSDSRDFSPRYAGTKEMVRTLRDDLKPGTTFLGHLDLTGAMLPSKVAREAKDSRDRTTQFFRDEWLAIKAKLYDGNLLRLSAIQKTKQRKSYFKRSSVSGKMKMKPEKFKGTQHDLKVRIVVNPEAYQIIPSATFKQGTNVGPYTLMALSTADGIIDFVASSDAAEVQHDSILSVVKSAYALLKRKASK